MWCLLKLSIGFIFNNNNSNNHGYNFYDLIVFCPMKLLLRCTITFLFLQKKIVAV